MWEEGGGTKSKKKEIGGKKDGQQDRKAWGEMRKDAR